MKTSYRVFVKLSGSAVEFLAFCTAYKLLAEGEIALWKKSHHNARLEVVN